MSLVAAPVSIDAGTGSQRSVLLPLQANSFVGFIWFAEIE